MPPLAAPLRDLIASPGPPGLGELSPLLGNQTNSPVAVLNSRASSTLNKKDHFGTLLSRGSPALVGKFAVDKKICISLLALIRWWFVA